jgi:hypothetical protein
MYNIVVVKEERQFGEPFEQVIMQEITWHMRKCDMRGNREARLAVR